MITAIKNALKERAIGTHTEKSHKYVICITDGIVYASVHDAADYNKGNRGRMSEAANGKVGEYKGKHWCFVDDIDQHIPELLHLFVHTQKPKKKATVYKCKKISKNYPNI